MLLLLLEQWGDAADMPAEGALESVVECGATGEISCVKEPFRVLSLPMADSLDAALHAFMNEKEELHGANVWRSAAADRLRITPALKKSKKQPVFDTPSLMPAVVRSLALLSYCSRFCADFEDQIKTRRSSPAHPASAAPSTMPASMGPPSRGWTTVPWRVCWCFLRAITARASRHHRVQTIPTHKKYSCRMPLGSRCWQI